MKNKQVYLTTGYKKVVTHKQFGVRNQSVNLPMTRANFLQGLIHHENKKKYGYIRNEIENVHLPSI